MEAGESPKPIVGVYGCSCSAVRGTGLRMGNLSFATELLDYLQQASHFAFPLAAVSTKREKTPCVPFKSTLLRLSQKLICKVSSSVTNWIIGHCLVWIPH